MPNLDFQRHTFLGGEVSPSLYERADMDQFSKWFSKAENIRFQDTGGFRNRPGFIKVAHTKNNVAGEKIKLLSFSFNDDESFLVELGPNYARFYRDGKPIIVDNVPYEITTPFSNFEDDDIKYAQAGDIIFLTSPHYGIYQLSRLIMDGTRWEIKKFASDIVPMMEENEDTSSTISASRYNYPGKSVSIFNPDSDVYLNVEFTFDGDVVFSSPSIKKRNLIETLTSYFEDDYKVVVADDKFILYSLDDPTEVIPSFSISFDTEKLVDRVSTFTQSYIYGNYAKRAIASYDGFYSIKDVYVSYNLYHGSNQPYQSFQGTKTVTAPDIQSSVEQAVGFGRRSMPTTLETNGIILHDNEKELWLEVFGRAMVTTDMDVAIIITGKEMASAEYSYESESYYTGDNNFYALSFSDESIANKIKENECILVKHSIDSQTVEKKYTTSTSGTDSISPIISNGKWRLYTVGNWTGDIVLKYSTDNKNTWTTFYKWHSQNANDTPANVNTSGAIESDDLVYLSMEVTVTSIGTVPLQLILTADNFTCNSYYKKISNLSNGYILAECVKNDVGTFAVNYKWRLPAFSIAEGWPQAVGFYQNRLFFAKDYILYGSKTNDFWNFYEPVDVKDDDPITMSLLSQKVNAIRNIVTQRSFFTFTAGGEFGIGSEGALTQKDKHLKPFSANGSAQCLPVLVSDVVLFVDKSYNAVRALKYSLEADGYEAPDITLALRYLLRNEKFISTDHIFEEKEALFLSDTGTIWVLKYVTDQNILSWSHWKHGVGKITDICVVPNGHKHDLYIAIEYLGQKWIEKMDGSTYMDTTEYFAASQDEYKTLQGVKQGDKKWILQDGLYEIVTVDNMGRIKTPADKSKPFWVGSQYVSTATLLTPSIQKSEYSNSTYMKQNPFKAFFYYTDSYGFSVGVEEFEKMEVTWKNTNEFVDDENKLTSGKKSVLIPSRFDGSARVTFVQDQPYPMEIQDALIETDFGGQ